MENLLPTSKHILPNGLRILTIPMPHSPSATVLVIVGVGSRQEEKELAGISHLIEHNVFKGTKSRPQRNQISLELEGLGAITNAFTSHEYTCYFAKVAAGKVGQILDVEMDIAQNMIFPSQDLEIERGNVIEEINMYEDNPPRRLHDNFLEFVWNHHAVGRKIIGTKETVSNISREEMLRFVKENYQTSQTIVVIAGAFDQKSVVRQVENCYQALEAKESIAASFFSEFQTGPRVYLENDQTQQTHLALGVKTFGRSDSRRFALDLLNNIFGEGLSSRLFRRIRDELGLAYYVGSENFEFQETGLWFTRAGVDTQRIEKAIIAILEEFKKLANEKIAETEIRKAKEYLKGKILLSTETSDDLAEWYGFQELLEKEVLLPQDYNQRIEAVSAADLQKVATDLLVKERWNLGVAGPAADSEKLQKILEVWS